jgi:hypothetical protein
LHGMQGVSGSNPLSSIPPKPYLFTGFTIDRQTAIAVFFNV